MVYPQQLTIQMRQRQLQNIYGDIVTYTGANPYLLTETIIAAAGTPPPPNPYIDYSIFTQGLDKITLSLSTTQTMGGEVPEGQFIPRKGASSILTFERDAKEFIKAILIDHVAAPLNQIEVQITDISGMSFFGFVIKSTDLSWCEFNSICTLDLNIKQQDEYTQCIERTLIADNWQGWFQTEPKTYNVGPPPTSTPKYHPRFSYCTEHRPNGTLVMIWYVTGLLGFLSTIAFGIALAYNGFAIMWNAIVAALVALGVSASPITLIDPFSPFHSMAQLYIESAGCGREHPAPLIRDYITNVCDKCGVRVDATTADIFFAPILSVNASDGTITNKPNPHYNACLFFPAVKRGVRRYASINLFGTSAMDNTTFFQEENAPIWALSDMLNHLSKVYNSRWKVSTDGTGQPFLYFKRKDWFQNQAPLYDFSIGGADRHKIIEGICYTPTEFTVPASMNGLYQDDPADKCGHEASRQQNGVPLSFNNTIVNPLFHGILDKGSGFAAAKFRLDGASTDYIYDAGQVVLNGSVLLPIIGGQLDTVFCFVRKYCDFALLLQTETVTLPKVIIWDGLETTGSCGEPASGNPYLNARALRTSISIAGTFYDLGHTAYPGTHPSVSTPEINTLYPSQIPVGSLSVPPSLAVPSTVPRPLAWEDIRTYPPNTNVIGHSLSFSPSVAGKYTVQNYFGTVISEQPALLVNYPMYFNPYYKDTMWDWFHWIDDPYKNPRLHKDWHLKIPLCKEDVQKLKADRDGYQVQLLQTVLLDTKFYNIGVITEITLSWDTSNNGDMPIVGQFIQLKGYV